MFRTILVFLAAAIAPLPFAAAQESTKGVRMRLFAVALLPDQGKVQIVAGDKIGPAFELPTYNLSDSMAVEARTFRLMAEPASADPKTAALCTIQFPEQGADFRVILVPKPDKTYHSIVVRGDDPKFVAGDVFFVNLSTHHVVGLLGTAKLDLESGDRELVRLEGAKAGVFFEVKIASREGEGITPLADTRWPVLRNNRSILVFHDDLNGQPAYRAVDEFLSPQKAKDAP
jgi:hypothetical protein